MLTATLWGGLAAASLLVGFFLASRGLSERTVGGIMGFGAGALISAIAYELIPTENMNSWQVAVAFLIGALAFYLGDRIVDSQGGADRKNLASEQKKGGSGSAIFIGTLLDNIPELSILGMGFATGGAINVAFLAAVFVSNLPEGLAGTLSLEAAGRTHRNVFWMWAILVIISATCAGLGYFIIQAVPTATGHFLEAFAAGAMLAMIAEAMMPEAFEHGGKAVGLYTVVGFLVAAILSVAE